MQHIGRFGQDVEVWLQHFQAVLGHTTVVGTFVALSILSLFLADSFEHLAQDQQYCRLRIFTAKPFTRELLRNPLPTIPPYLSGPAVAILGTLGSGELYGRRER